VNWPRLLTAGVCSFVLGAAAGALLQGDRPARPLVVIAVAPAHAPPGGGLPRGSVVVAVAPPARRPAPPQPAPEPPREPAVATAPLAPGRPDDDEPDAPRFALWPWAVGACEGDRARIADLLATQEPVPPLQPIPLPDPRPVRLALDPRATGAASAAQAGARVLAAGADEPPLVPLALPAHREGPALSPRDAIAAERVPDAPLAPAYAPPPTRLAALPAGPAHGALEPLPFPGGAAGTGPVPGVLPVPEPTPEPLAPAVAAAAPPLPALAPFGAAPEPLAVAARAPSSVVAGAVAGAVSEAVAGLGRIPAPGPAPEPLAPAGSPTPRLTALAPAGPEPEPFPLASTPAALPRLARAEPAPEPLAPALPPGRPEVPAFTAHETAAPEVAATEVAATEVASAPAPPPLPETAFETPPGGPRLPPLPLAADADLDDAPGTVLPPAGSGHARGLPPAAESVEPLAVAGGPAPLPAVALAAPERGGYLPLAIETPRGAVLAGTLPPRGEEPSPLAPAARPPILSVALAPGVDPGPPAVPGGRPADPRPALAPEVADLPPATATRPPRVELAEPRPEPAEPLAIAASPAAPAWGPVGAERLGPPLALVPLAASEPMAPRGRPGPALVLGRTGISDLTAASRAGAVAFLDGAPVPGPPVPAWAPDPCALPPAAPAEPPAAVARAERDGTRPHAEAPSAEVPSAEGLARLLARADFRLDAVRGRGGPVPRLFVDRLPDDLHRVRSSEARKELFVGAVLPLVLRVNEEILAERHRLKRLAEDARAGRAPGPADRAWLARLAERYDLPRAAEGARPDFKAPDFKAPDFKAPDFKAPDFKALLERVDVVPPSLALGQAAEESGWGTSRAARAANALFGETAWRVEGGRATGAVRRFEAVDESVRAYARNLNTHPAYGGLRAARAAQRAAGREPDGHALAGGLERYSERGRAYIASVRAIIRGNGFGGLDRARLRPPAAPLRERPDAQVAETVAAAGGGP
jgi:Bax protein